MDETSTNIIVDFVEQIVSDVTTAVPMTVIASAVGAIIAGGLIYFFAMKYGRKAFEAIKNALQGKGFHW